MRNRARAILAIAAFLSMASGASGSDCNAVLVGIHNKDFIKSSTDSVEALVTLLEESRASSYSEASGFAGSMGLKLPLEGIPVELSSSVSSSDSRNGSWAAKLRKYLSSNASSKREFERLFEYANSDVISAWRECISGNVGIRVWADDAASVSDDATYVNLQWAPPMLSLPEPVIKKVDYDASLLELVSPTDLIGRKVPYNQALPVTFRRLGNPERTTYISIFTDSSQFQRRIVLAGLPKKFTPPPPVIARSKEDYNGDRIADVAHFEGNTIVVKLGGIDAEVRTTPSADYNTGIGLMRYGDFNADGCTDIVHVLNLKQRELQYAHVHISNCGGGFYSPSKFYFAQASNSPDYDSSQGMWEVRDCRTSQPESERQSVLVHFARTDATHYWIPDATGREMRINIDCNG